MGIGRGCHLSPCRKPASQGFAMHTTHVPSSSSKVCVRLLLGRACCGGPAHCARGEARTGLAEHSGPPPEGPGHSCASTAHGGLRRAGQAAQPSCAAHCAGHEALGRSQRSLHLSSAHEQASTVPRRTQACLKLACRVTDCPCGPANEVGRDEGAPSEAEGLLRMQRR